jgi:hypothetical protein
MAREAVRSALVCKLMRRTSAHAALKILGFIYKA